MSWKPDPFSRGQDAFQINGGKKFSCTFPPFVLIRMVLKKLQQNDSNITSMARLVLVSSVTITLNKELNPSPSQRQSTKGSIKQLPTANSGKLAQYTGLDSLRENLHAEGISKRVAKLTTNSHQQGFLKHFESAWAKWSSWCIAREISPTRSPLNFGLFSNAF